MPLKKGQKDDSSSSGLHGLAFRQFLKLVIPAFRMDVRPQETQCFDRRVFVEARDKIHARKPCKNGGPVRPLANRTARTFEAPDRIVRIQADDQHVAQVPGSAQIIHMPRMQKIETAVRERENPRRPVAGGERNLDAETVTIILIGLGLSGTTFPRHCS